MADWGFATGDAVTVKQWHRKFTIQAKTESFFYENGLVSRQVNNAVIRELPDLEGKQGDKITYGQIRELSGAGVPGGSTMEGNEEAPDVYDDDVTLEQIRNAVRTDYELSMMRPSDDAYRSWAMELLARWRAGVLDQSLFTALGTSSTKAIYGGDATSTATIEAGDYLTLYMISKYVAYAKKATPRIIGPQYKGMKTNGVMVCGIDQSHDLTERDSAWNANMMEARLRGKTNPVFTGALGMKKMVPIQEHVRCPVSTTWGSGSNIDGATAFILGVGAGVIAYGKKRIWNEKTFDYGDKVGFCIGYIGGVSKTVLNSADNAVVELRTYRSNN
jgi:N4-gp56 family major capsid protein